MTVLTILREFSNRASFFLDKERTAKLKDCFIGHDDQRIPIIQSGSPANYFDGAIWSIRKEFFLETIFEVTKVI